MDHGAYPLILGSIWRWHQANQNPLSSLKVLYYYWTFYHDMNLSNYFLQCNFEEKISNWCGHSVSKKIFTSYLLQRALWAHCFELKRFFTIVILNMIFFNADSRIILRRIYFDHFVATSVLSIESNPLSSHL